MWCYNNKILVCLRTDVDGVQSQLSRLSAARVCGVPGRTPIMIKARKTPVLRN